MRGARDGARDAPEDARGGGRDGVERAFTRHTRVGGGDGFERERDVVREILEESSRERDVREMSRARGEDAVSRREDGRGAVLRAAVLGSGRGDTPRRQQVAGDYLPRDDPLVTPRIEEASDARFRATRRTTPRRTSRRTTRPNRARRWDRRAFHPARRMPNRRRRRSRTAGGRRTGTTPITRVAARAAFAAGIIRRVAAARRAACGQTQSRRRESVQRRGRRHRRQDAG